MLKLTLSYYYIHLLFWLAPKFRPQFILLKQVQAIELYLVEVKIRFLKIYSKVRTYVTRSRDHFYRTRRQRTVVIYFMRVYPLKLEFILSTNNYQVIHDVPQWKRY